MVLGFLTTSHPGAEREKGIPAYISAEKVRFIQATKEWSACQEVSSWFQGLPISDKAGIWLKRIQEFINS